jgi:hypothetical protein
MKKMILLALAGVIMFAGCNKSESVSPTAKNHPSGSTLSSTNGSSSIELIYYDGQKFMMNLMPLDQSGSALLTHNKSTNNLYEATGFLTVTDAIQKDGYNPIWQEVDITFVTIAPKQFLSDNDVLAAAALGQITLTPTGEMYRCDIIQQSKPQ